MKERHQYDLMSVRRMIYGLPEKDRGEFKKRETICEEELETLTQEF